MESVRREIEKSRRFWFSYKNFIKKRIKIHFFVWYAFFIILGLVSKIVVCALGNPWVMLFLPFDFIPVLPFIFALITYSVHWLFDKKDTYFGQASHRKKEEYIEEVDEDGVTTARYDELGRRIIEY